MKKISLIMLCASYMVNSNEANSLKISLFQPKVDASSQSVSNQNMFNFSNSVKIADPEDVARDFINSQKKQLGYFSMFASEEYDTEDLALSKIDKAQNSTHVIFEQKLDGIPVFAQQLKVHLRKDNSVVLMNGQYVNLEDAEVENIVIIKSNQAIHIAEKDLGVDQISEPSKSEEIFISRRNKLIRGYKVTAFAGMMGEFIYLIDAQQGKIIKSYNQVLHPNGTKSKKSEKKSTDITKNMWQNLRRKANKSLKEISNHIDRNPKAALSSKFNSNNASNGPVGLIHSASIKTDPEAKAVILDNLNNELKLEGKFVSVQNNAADNAAPVNGKFVFDTESTHYDEVMVYHHINEAHKYIVSLGVQLNERAIPATVHYNDDDNSFYSPDKKALFFGDGGVPDSADADIILHEWGHSVVDSLSGLQGGWGSQGGAMHEGYGDYVAATYFGDPNVGEWDSSAYSDTGYLRTLNNKKVFPDDLQQSVHDDGEIWSGTLWDLRKELGKQIADELVFHSLKFLPQKALFKDGLIAILSVDQLRFKEKYRKPILRVFFKRGIKIIEEQIEEATKKQDSFNELYATK